MLKFEQSFKLVKYPICSLHAVKKITYQSFNVEEFLSDVHQINVTGLNKTGTVPEPFGNIRKYTTIILQQHTPQNKTKPQNEQKINYNSPFQL